MIRAKIGVFHQIPNPYRPPPDPLTAGPPKCFCRRKKKWFEIVRHQKGKSQNGCYKKTNHAKFSGKKTDISYPLIRILTCAYQGVRNVCFSKNLACLFSCNPCFEIRLCASLRTNWYKFLKDWDGWTVFSIGKGTSQVWWST